MQHVQLASAFAQLDTDYAEAVVHLAWAVNRQTRERLLACAAVELLPREVPAPVACPERSTKLSGRFFLYTRTVVVSSQRGLNWFLDLAQGNAIRPNPDGTFRDSSDPDRPRFIVGAFEQEPPGPAFLTARSRVPFSTDWHHSPRAKHLITHSPPFRDWTPQERAKATAWLAAEAHVDLDQFPEYAGSTHLLAPNPIFRSLLVRPAPSDETSPALLVAFTPRAGRTVAGLQLIVEERRATGTCVLACVRVTDATMRIQLPHSPAEIRERVIDAERGLLYDGGFGVFVGGFDLTVEHASTTRRVEPGGTAAPYEVSVLDGFSTQSHVDVNEGPTNAPALLATARAGRAQRERGEALQKWFRDQAPDAVQALRNLVTRAKGTVFVCDPYFGGGDLLKVILAIADPKTSVQILTSAKHLRDLHGAVGDDLEKVLTQALNMPPVNPIEVRVMPGDDPAIHDRFLVVGNEMWMLGASLNHFGERGTLMVKVPDPDPVRADLKSIWDTASTLSSWLQRRRTQANQ